MSFVRDGDVEFGFDRSAPSKKRMLSSSEKASCPLWALIKRGANALAAATCARSDSRWSADGFAVGKDLRDELQPVLLEQGAKTFSAP